MAGGEGKRMRSTTPKVLHKVMGEPMIVRIIKKVLQLNIDTIYIVCGRAMSEIQSVVNTYFVQSSHNILFVEQPIARGTGDAVKYCLPLLANNTNVLILNGDTPLVDTTLDLFIGSQAPALMVTNLEKPYGNGRIVTNTSGKFMCIVEEKDASAEEKRITLVNCGVYLVSSKDLATYIPQLLPNNAQNEYYLTDICGLLSQELTLVEVPKEIQYELINVNCPSDLMLSERYAIERHLRSNGLTIRPLEESDGDKGYLELLSQLSDTIDDKSFAYFQNVYWRIMRNPYHHVFVVEDTNTCKVISSVTLLVEPKFIHNSEHVGHIEDVVVSPAYRSKKIGKMLVDYVITFVHEFNCYKMILDCDQALTKFYEKSGFISKNVQMSLYTT
jgi:NDP-sugar pyrophosphorylase family protein